MSTNVIHSTHILIPGLLGTSAENDALTADSIFKIFLDPNEYDDLDDGEIMEFLVGVFEDTEEFRDKGQWSLFRNDHILTFDYIPTHLFDEAIEE